MRMLQVVVYMPQELLDRIDAEAAQEKENRSNWIRTACEDRMDPYLKKKTDPQLNQQE